MNCLYTLKNISVSYPKIGADTTGKFELIPALVNISLDIYKNEYLVVLGENGSGKSSLARLLAGIARNVTGDFYFKGQKIEGDSSELMQNISLVLQEPQNQLLMPIVARELAFPLENRGYNPDLIESKVQEMATLFGLEKILSASPDELSGGQITSLAIATASITDPEIIILDEPDSHLDNRTKEIFNEFINRYRNSKTIILISQFSKAADNADRVLILENGTVKTQGKPDQVLRNLKVNKKNSPKSVAAYENNSSSVNRERVRINRKKPLLSLKDVCYAYNDDNSVLKDINFELFADDRIAVAGLSGSGKSTLGFIMTGLLKPARGTVYYENRLQEELSSESRRDFITMAMQFPERALFEETVARDVAFGLVNSDITGVSRIVDDLLAEFDIIQLKNRHPLSLSGGEKRKAALAGVLALKSKIIILDEPSAALDRKSTERLIEIINSYNNTFIVISHDFGFISNTCNRIIGLENGRIVCDLSVAEFFADEVLLNRFMINREIHGF